MTPDNTNPNRLPDAETVFFQGRPALRGITGTLILNSGMGITLILISILYQGRFAWLPLVGLIIAAALVAVPVLVTRSVHYRITSYRIDFERGLLSKTIDTLELWHVEDIKFHQSLMDRILRIGTITIISHDSTTPVLHLENLPGPRPIFDALKQRIIVVKRQRGVIKLDPG